MTNLLLDDVQLPHILALLVISVVGVILGWMQGNRRTSLRPLLPRSRIPAPTLRFADDYVATVSKQLSETERRDIEEQFSRSFFDGFVRLGATMEGGTSAMRRGFVAGQEYRRANPDKARETMEAFGYAEIEADGVWSGQLEHYGFSPAAQPKQIWWVSGFGIRLPDSVEAKRLSFNGVQVRVRGYASPYRRCGHLGGYDREIL